MKDIRDLLSGAQKVPPALLVILSWVALSLVLPFVGGFVRDRFMLQDSLRATLAATAAWTLFWLTLAIVGLALAHVQLTLRLVTGLAAWAIVVAWFAGPAALAFANGVGTESGGQPVEFNIVHFTGNTVRLKTRGLDGVTFTCSAAKWRRRNQGPQHDLGAGVAGTLRRGRLGLWWGEIP